MQAPSVARAYPVDTFKHESSACRKWLPSASCCLSTQELLNENRKSTALLSRLFGLSIYLDISTSIWRF